jgi:hypothetical protein
MNTKVLEMIAPQRAHYYADVDDPRINFLVRLQSTSHDLSNVSVQIARSSSASTSNLALHAANTTGSADCSSGSAFGSSYIAFNKELVLQSSDAWDDAPEPTISSDITVELAPAFPKTYVPFRDLLDHAKNAAAAQQATPLCTAWITFSAGARVDSILVLNSSLSLAVQFFLDSRCPPRLRTIAATKPLLYNVCDTGVLAEFQSAAVPPLWSGDPRFNESNQCVSFASWNFWREHAPSASCISMSTNTPSFCTAWSSCTGKSFRFHFLSTGELVVIGTTSGFLCKGSSIIADREVALSAFQKFNAGTQPPSSAALSKPDCCGISRPTFNICSLCLVASTSENLPAKGAWKSGENLYDRLIISSWARRLNELVSRAALDSSDLSTKALKINKRGRFTNFHKGTDNAAEQTWEEFQELESQREHRDRIYAQKLQDEEAAALRLSALRSRRQCNSVHAVDQEARVVTLRDSVSTLHRDQPNGPGDEDASAHRLPAAEPISRHKQPPMAFSADCTHRGKLIENFTDASASPNLKTPSSLLSSPNQPDVISDSDISDSSPSASSTGINRFSSSASGHRIRFIFKNDHTIPLVPNTDLPSSHEITLLQCHNLHQVLLCTPHSRCFGSDFHEIFHLVAFPSSLFLFQAIRELPVGRVCAEIDARDKYNKW